MLRVQWPAFGRRLAPAVWVDRDVLPYAVQVSVWGRWFIALVAVFLLAYRPGQETAQAAYAEADEVQALRLF